MNASKFFIVAVIVLVATLCHAAESQRLSPQHKLKSASPAAAVPAKKKLIKLPSIVLADSEAPKPHTLVNPVVKKLKSLAPLAENIGTISVKSASPSRNADEIYAIVKKILKAIKDGKQKKYGTKRSTEKHHQRKHGKLGDNHKRGHNHHHEHHGCKKHCHNRYHHGMNGKKLQQRNKKSQKKHSEKNADESSSDQFFRNIMNLFVQYQ